MRVPVTPQCGKVSAKTGECTIYLQYCYNWDPDLKTLLKSEITIDPKYWDKKRKCVRETVPEKYGTADDLNKEIDRQIKLAGDLIRLAKGQGVVQFGPFVKEKYHPKLDLENFALEAFQIKAYVPEVKKKKEGFFAHLEEYVKMKKKKTAEGSATVYDSMVLHLEAFEEHRDKPIGFDSLDFEFYEDFVDYLTFKYPIPRKKSPQYGLKLNTIGKTIKNFRMFIKDRVKRKVIPAIDLTDYKIPEEEADAIYLTHEEIAKIYHLDLSDEPDLIPYRNRFVLACLTGLRFSDFALLDPTDLRNDMLHKKQEKSDHWVVIPLRKEAKEIFTEEFKGELTTMSNVKFNEKIKIIAKKAGISQIIKFSYKKGSKMIEERRPKYAWITSHTARRSFCTNEFLKGTPVYLIMKISGHKREKDFYRYIRISPQEAADKIKKLWMERDEFEVFKNPLKRAVNLQSI
jgi:site-specific recombinase XerD